MPVCTSESVSRLWSAAGSRPGSTGSSPPSPSSPVSCSPPPRTLVRSSSSTFTLLDRRCLAPSPTPPDQDDTWLARLVGWYPSFCLRFLRDLAATLMYLAWTQLLLMGPTLWLSAWLWLFWKLIQLPLSLAKWALTVAFVPACERARKKRTVLISGGSTVQALHLARNFYTAGARVVVIEVEGLFALARFSTAVNKFYSVPKPAGDRAEAYLEAVKKIVAKERAGYYIPVSVSTTGYYDALLKPHLELLGCQSFCPGVKEVCVLDDVLELLRRCTLDGLPTPLYYPVTSKEEVYKLYDDETLRTGRHIIVNVGSLGCRDRVKVLLPRSKREFRFPYVISANRPWVIVRDYPGDHFVTCTTVKDSQVVANVTCKTDSSEGGQLEPVERPEVELWLRQFFSRLKLFRPVSGHLSFKFVESPEGMLVPLGCKVGVSLPYILHTSVHPRIVWRPCRHFSRQGSGPLVLPAGRYWIHEAVVDTLKNPSVDSVSKLIGTVLDKREALFTYWDPLPYCAYYHLQLPLNHVLRFLEAQNVQHGFHPPILANGH